jgi:hypothetical protein
MEASRDRLRQAIVNANAILHTTKCDPRFLSEVEKMNTAVGMLGSGGNNDSGGGGVDHTLEDLRWYVYQQEVSQYLRDGMEEVPDTLLDDALLGAIHVRIDGKQRETLSTGDSDNMALAWLMLQLFRKKIWQVVENAICPQWKAHHLPWRFARLILVQLIRCLFLLFHQAHAFYLPWKREKRRSRLVTLCSGANLLLRTLLHLPHLKAYKMVVASMVLMLQHHLLLS